MKTKKAKQKQYLFANTVFNLLNSWTLKI